MSACTTLNPPEIASHDRPLREVGRLAARVLKSSSALVAAGRLDQPPGPMPINAHAQGSDVIKVGLVGCGGRGTGAAEQSINASTNIKLHAMGDLFKDHLDNSYNNLAKFGDKIDVADDRKFIGFDAYKQVIASGVDLVILATPPGFRPKMIEAVIAAGKNLFTEKPVAVDGSGHPDRARCRRGGQEEEAGRRRRHPAPPPGRLHRGHEAYPRRRHRRDRHRRAAATGTRAGSGRSTGPPPCPTWSTSSATGSTTPGSRATTSASSTSTTST